VDEPVASRLLVSRRIKAAHTTHDAPHLGADDAPLPGVAVPLDRVAVDPSRSAVQHSARPDANHDSGMRELRDRCMPDEKDVAGDRLIAQDAMLLRERRERVT
jgi:hypothetical protein